MPTLQVAINAAKARQGADEFTNATRRMSRSATEVTRGTGQLNTRLSTLGGTARRVGVAIAGLFGGITGAIAIRSAVRTIASFEQTLATVRGVTRATADEFDRLSSAAREMGATTRFSATEAGEGLLFLARAGFDVDQSIKALPATLNLAVAGAIGLGQAADIASNVLTAFGLNAAETERVVDSLLNTSNNANTNITQLAEAMKFAAPIAGSLGVSVEETSAAIGVLGNAGIQASLAGTGLRMALLRLLTPTSDVERTVEALGLTMKDLDPTSKSLVEIFETLRGTTFDVTDAAIIFGARSAAVADQLVNNIDTFKSLVQVQKENRGEAERMAKVMDDTLNGAFKRLVSVTQELFLTLGEGASGRALRDLVDSMANGVTNATEAFVRFQESVIITRNGLVTIGSVAEATFLVIRDHIKAIIELIGDWLDDLNLVIATTQGFVEGLSTPGLSLRQRIAVAGTTALGRGQQEFDRQRAIEAGGAVVGPPASLAGGGGFFAQITELAAELDRLDELQKKNRDFIRTEAEKEAVIKERNNQLEMSISLMTKEEQRLGMSLADRGASIRQEKELAGVRNEANKEIEALFSNLELERELLNVGNEERDIYIKFLELEKLAKEGLIDSNLPEQYRQEATELLSATIAQEEHTRAAEEAAEAQDQLTRARNRQRESLDSMMSNLKFQQSLLGKSGVDRAVAISERRVRLAGEGLPEEEIAAKAREAGEITRLIEETRKLDQISDQIGRAFSDMFTGIVRGAQSAEEAIARLAESIAELLIQQLIAQPIATGISTGIQAGIGALTGIPQLQHGGIVTQPTVALIGEAGPEAVVPLNQMGKTINVNMKVETPNVDAFRRSARQIIGDVRRVTGGAL